MDQSWEPSPYSTIISDKAQGSLGHSCLPEPYPNTAHRLQEWAGPQKAAGTRAGRVQRRLMLPTAGPRDCSPEGRLFYFLGLSFFFFGLIPFLFSPLSLYLLPTELNRTSLYLFSILSELTKHIDSHMYFLNTKI